MDRKKQRLEGYNYSKPGDYFVTICTKYLIEYFGYVESENVKLSEMGKIVEKYWLDIPNHFENTKLDKHIVMPNHVHGIVRIKQSIRMDKTNRRGKIYLAPTKGIVRTKKQNNLRKYQLLPQIIGTFKAAVTRNINLSFPNNNFSWQRSYYDHIIETQDALDNILEYIELNPLNWQTDKENANLQKS